MQPTFKALYTEKRFPGQPKPNRGVLEFSASDLAHALFATGRAPGDEWAFRRESLWEFWHRFALMPAYVQMKIPEERLVLSALARSLDRSEKVGLSYALGNAIAGIYARRRLGVDFLMHVDRYGNTYGLAYGTGRTRADFFGPLSGAKGWVVVEAKGRSNGMESTLEPKLIKQKHSIRTINGVRPDLSVGCCASFPLPAQYLRFDAVDPEADEETSIDLEISLDRYAFAYYRPFVEAVASAPIQALDVRANESTEITYAVGRFPDFGLSIGLPTPIVQAVGGRSRIRVPTGFYAETVAVLGQVERGGAVQRDGVLMDVEWEVSSVEQTPTADESNA